MSKISRSLLFIVFSSSLLVGCPSKPTPTTATFKVATYNVRNLFDGDPKTVAAIKKLPRVKFKEKAKPQAELEALSTVLHELNADVIALQEVESKSTLKGFQDKYLKDLNYQEPILIEGNDPRGIDVALLTRFKAVEIKSHKDTKFGVVNKDPRYKNKKAQFSRDLLQVKLEVSPKYQFTCFVTHLKSQIGGFKADVKREAETAQVANLVQAYQKQEPQGNYLIMGDFNEVPSGMSMKPLLYNSSLKLQDAVGTDLGLGKEIFSYHPKKYRSRIDYLLISSSMQPEYVGHSVQIYQHEKALAASDHLPVVATFDPTKEAAKP